MQIYRRNIVISDQIWLHQWINTVSKTIYVAKIILISPNVPQMFPVPKKIIFWGTSFLLLFPKTLLRNMCSCSCSPRHFWGTHVPAPITQTTFQEQCSCSCSPMNFLGTKGTWEHVPHNLGDILAWHRQGIRNEYLEFYSLFL